MMDVEKIKAGFKESLDRFLQFIQNPLYQLKKQVLLSPEELTFYVVTLSVPAIVINLIANFGLKGLFGLVTIPFFSLIMVGMWLVVGYIVNMVAFKEKTYDVKLVSNLAAFSNSFWILTQVIPYLSSLMWLLGFVLFCEAFAIRSHEPKSKVYWAFGIAYGVSVVPMLFAFKYT
jgi:hypothetical protein